MEDRERQQKLISTALVDKPLVAIGSKVKVKWLDGWYNGRVVDIAPQKQGLYEVVHSNTGLSVVLHLSQLKSIDSGRQTNDRFNLGADIAYYDNCLADWQSGTIKKTNVAACYIVEWNRGESSNGENVNWFMDHDVEPNIESESRHILDQELQDDDSPPLPPPLQVSIATEVNALPSVEAVLEGKHVYRTNDVFETSMKDPIEAEHEESFDTFLPNLETLMEDDSPHSRPITHPNQRRTSVSMKQYYAKTFERPPRKKGKPKQQLDEYLDKQHALLHDQLDHSLLPAVWSCLTVAGKTGIPHHPSSKFFLVHQPNMSRAQSTVFSRSKGGLPRSTTMSSRAESEPGGARGKRHNFKLLGSLMRREQNSRGLTKQRTNMSLRPLPPVPGRTKGNPYEVPVKSKSAVNLGMKKQSRKSSGDSDIYEELKLSDSKLGKTKSGILIKNTSSKKQMGTVGGTVTMYCEVKSSSHVTYEWFKDGKKLTHNDEQVAFPEPGKLQLYSLTLQNVGRYQCRITDQANHTEVFESILKVEGDTIKRSFSRDQGLDKLGKSAAAGDCYEANDTSSVVNMPSMDTISFHNAPSFSSFLKSPSSMDLTKELIDKDVQRLATEEGKSTGKKKQKKSKDKKSKKTKSGEGRKASKNNRGRKTSNVINKEMESYLDGFGEDYGKTAGILDPPAEKKKKKKGKKSNKDSDKKEPKATFAVQNDDDFTVSDSGYTESTRPMQVEIEELSVMADNNEENVDWEEFDPQEVNTNHNGSYIHEQYPEQRGEAPPIHHHGNMSSSNGSIDVYPDYGGSLTSVSSEMDHRGQPQGRCGSAGTGSKKGSSNVDLPLAVEHYTESIRRLQKSNEQYEEHFGKQHNKDERNSSSLLSKMLKIK